MARLADEVTERIKRDISLVRLVESQGYALKKHGKDYSLSCPFHDDKTASLIITPATNLWHCMGACQKGGSVIDWVMQTQGVSFRFACELLQKDLGLITEAPSKAPTKNTTTKLTPPLAANADSQTALKQVIDYYHETFKQSPEVQEYLRSRGLDHPELIERFKLGFANRTLGYRLPEKNRKAGAEQRGLLQAIGILRDSGHEHFNGALVVPIFDENGHISEVYGRKLLNHLRPGTAYHLYLPGPHRGVWNLRAFAASADLILCEALIDAMTFWVQGYRNVTASYGVQGFTDDHLAACKKYGIRRVLIAYDSDAAGDTAAEKLAKRLSENGLDVGRIRFPPGLDANAYAQRTASASDDLGQLIRQAEWLAQGQTVLPPATVAPIFSADPLPSADPLSPAALSAASDLPVASPATPDLPAATPVLPTPADPLITVGDQELLFTRETRVYRIRGLDKNSSPEQLKINLLVRQADAFHQDKLDLYSSKQRQVFINHASVELGIAEAVLKKDLGQLLLGLEAHQNPVLADTGTDPHTNTPPSLTAEARQAALALLRDPALLERLLQDFAQAGVVGEETNKLAGYLACVSRHLDKPLAVLIQSSSAAGKSALMDAILALIPEEARVQYSALTGQSLFYMGERDLQHKILAIAEEEGASNASYALKLLQSEGVVTIASTGKDDSTGHLVTREYTVQGPVMLFMTTTAIDIDEELLNRCLVLTVNESREQTQAIHTAQRSKRTLQGLQDKLAKAQIIALHHNAQRLLQPLSVINPYADQLTFLDDKTRTRRDHEKYLTLIDSIALLHQYQRDIKTLQHQGQRLDYVEVTPDDIEMANRLAHEILGRSLDELPPQTRQLLKAIQALVQDACQRQGLAQRDFRFSRKTIRDFTQWSDGQLKIHCRRLEELEYLLIHRGGRGHALEYELLYNGTSAHGKQLMGLLDVAFLRGYDVPKSGRNPNPSGSSQSQVGAKSAPSQPPTHPPSVRVPAAYREKSRPDSDLVVKTLELGHQS